MAYVDNGEHARVRRQPLPQQRDQPVARGEGEMVAKIRAKVRAQVRVGGRLKLREREI